MPVTLLVAMLVVLALVVFLTGVIWAGWLSIKKRPEMMPKFLQKRVTNVGGVLATNLGAVLGLAAVDAGDGIFRMAIFLRVGEWDRVPGHVIVQVGAAYFYVISLLIAFGFWAATRFDEDPSRVVPTLPELAQTLLGVAVGMLAVLLGVDVPAS